MIDNIIFQTLVILFLGFCLGVLATIWYVLRISKNVVLKFLLLLGSKIKASDITAAEVWRTINKVVNESLEETKHEEKKHKFKEEFNNIAK
jgi:hypothetical protein